MTEARTHLDCPVLKRHGCVTCVGCPDFEDFDVRAIFSQPTRERRSNFLSGRHCKMLAEAAITGVPRESYVPNLVVAFEANTINGILHAASPARSAATVRQVSNGTASEVASEIRRAVSASGNRLPVAYRLIAACVQRAFSARSFWLSEPVLSR